MKNRQFVTVATAVIVVAALVPMVVKSPHWLNTLNIAFYYVLLASSWNLMLGYAGLFSFAHTALAAVGGYASALLAIKAGVHPALAMPLGGAIAAASSSILGVVSLRLRGFYLCLVTWAFAEIATGILRVEYQVTGGTMGLVVPGLFPADAGKEVYYWVGLGLVVLYLVFMVALAKSRVGLYLRSIRDDELASEVLGVDTTLWKVFCFTVCGFWAGLAGAYYGHYIGVVDPSIGSLSEMGLVILMVVIGGMGSIVGPVVGAVLVTIISELLRGSLAAMSMLFFAAVFMLVMRFFPGGLMAALQRVRGATGAAFRRAAQMS
ncbi:MAG: branched-chain amino acid ABC transporter permease [Chloroflexota bacterium]